MAQDETPPEDLADRGTIMDDDAQDASGPIPDSIGSYDIKGVIGAGAMGVVYLARQSSPERDVAIKVMKSGVVSRKAMRRFEFEAQTLGRLQHPAIAQVYEANTWDDGDGARPFFAMEYVTGAKELGDFVQDNQLDAQARLELFCGACEGVEYGHRRGVIHRDLKPGNILVDAEGRPKIIDFGVARSTDADAVSATLATEAGQLIGTLQYMSPEQVELDPADLDTRSDVYALGVILYQLLANKLPYDLTGTSLAQAASRIKEIQPQRISEINASLKGDLETISLKALEKERDQRYQSVVELAEDIRRYLADEPINARPPTRMEQFRRFVRKNKAAAIASGVVAAALMAATTISIVFAVKAERQRDNALKQAYFGNIHAAQASIERGDLIAAGKRLSTARSAMGNPAGSELPFEWQRLHSQLDDSLLMWTGHDRVVLSTAFSPDGSRIVSGGFDDVVHIWDAGDGSELAAFPGHGQSVRCVDFSPDGLRIASGGDDSVVRIREAASGDVVATLEGHKLQINALAFSPDGLRMATGSIDTTVRLWDSTSGEELWSTRSMLGTRNGHRAYVNAVAFSPDGSRIVSGGRDKIIRIWNAGDGATLAAFPGHRGYINAVAFSPDGSRIVSGSDDGIVRMWNAITGEVLASLEGHEGIVHAVTFSPDGARIISCSSDKTVRIWDVETGRKLTSMVGHEGLVATATPSPDGLRIVSGGSNGVLRLWNAATGDIVLTLDGHDELIMSVAFSPDGSLIASGSHDDTVRIWDAESRASLAVLAGHNDAVIALKFSADGSQVFSGSRDGAVHIRDATNGAVLTALEVSTSASSMVFSPDGSRAALGTFDGTVRLLEIPSGEELATFTGHEGVVLHMAFSPDSSQVLTSSIDKTVRLWDAVTGEELAILLARDAQVSAVAFGAQGFRFAASYMDESTVLICDATTGDLLTTLTGHHKPVSSLAFSPDGIRIASGSWDETIRIWDISSGEELVTLVGHNGMIRVLAFSPDGLQLVSSSTETALRVWDTHSRGEIADAQRLTHSRYARLSPVVGSWFEKAGGDSELILAMFDREIKKRPPKDMNTLRNLILKHFTQR